MFGRKQKTENTTTSTSSKSSSKSSSNLNSASVIVKGTVIEGEFYSEVALQKREALDGSANRGSWMGNPLLPGELSNRRGLCLKQGCAPTDYRTVSEA